MWCFTAHEEGEASMGLVLQPLIRCVFAGKWNWKVINSLGKILEYPTSCIGSLLVTVVSSL